MEPRNIVLAVLVALIALGVLYMLDPTFGGILRHKKEGFFSNNAMEQLPASVGGGPAGAFAAEGNEDRNNIVENQYNASGANENMSPMSPNAATEGFENLSPSPMPFSAAEKPANCYPKNQLAPQELLPNDPNSKWAQVNPMGAGDIAGKNFLNAGSLIGVNTVGQSLRNASWDLRSETPNPQVQVSPWQQSTIEADLSRRPLEMA